MAQACPRGWSGARRTRFERRADQVGPSSWPQVSLRLQRVRHCPSEPARPSFRTGRRRGHARVAQYQEDLHPGPAGPAFRCTRGPLCRCGRRVQGVHPLQIRCPLGPRRADRPYAVETGQVLNKQLRCRLQIGDVVRRAFGLTVVPSAIIRALHRAATKALPPTRAGPDGADSPMVVADETGWRVHAELQWLWVCVTPDDAVYVILPAAALRKPPVSSAPPSPASWSRRLGAYRQFYRSGPSNVPHALDRRAPSLQEEIILARSCRGKSRRSSRRL